jgi:hypothetical protein
VDDGHIDDGDALGHGHEVVPSSARAGGGAIGGHAGAIGEPGEAAEGGLECGGNARPVHSTAQNPFKDVMAQRGLCRQGRAPHAVVSVRVAQGDPTAAVHIRSVGGKHGKAKAVPEAHVELPTFELESSGEWESIQPGGGRAAGAAEESGPGALAILGAGGKGGQQGVCSGLGRVPGECALRLRNDTHGVWAGLAVLRRPEADGGVVQGLPQWPELLAAGSVKGPEQRGPSSHGKLGGGSVALGWACACQAKAAVAEGEGDLVGEGPVCAGVGLDGKGAVYRFVLGTSVRQGRRAPTCIHWASAPPASGGSPGGSATGPGFPGAVPGAPP